MSERDPRELSPREAVGWIRWGLRRRRRAGGAGEGAAPLEFPNRVTVELRSGAAESARSRARQEVSR